MPSVSVMAIQPWVWAAGIVGVVLLIAALVWLLRDVVREPPRSENRSESEKLADEYERERAELRRVI